MADEQVEEKTLAERARDAQDAITGVAQQAKESLDANKDGSVSFDEVVYAGADRVIETKNAMVDGAREVHEAFDINGDGKVTLDEVGSVAKDAAKAAGEGIGGLVDKAKGMFDGLMGKLDD